MRDPGRPSSVTCHIPHIGTTSFPSILARKLNDFYLQRVHMPSCSNVQCGGLHFLKASEFFTMSASVFETMDYIGLLKNIEQENSQKNENHQRASQRAYMVHTLELE